MPRAEIGFIGGSSTFDIRFPEDVAAPKGGVTVIADGAIFRTPYGESPPFKIFSLEDDRGETTQVLTCRMHGWRAGVTRRQASCQVFWVFREAGVQSVLAEGGVGAVSRLLEPRDLVIVDDYIDVSTRRDVSISDDYLLIMREPFCPELRDVLEGVALDLGARDFGRVFRRGVYAVTDGRHFESRAEVAALKTWGADVVGQSLAPEVYLAREIGSCYAGLYLVVNYAEGVVRDWEHEELTDAFRSCAPGMGELLLEAIRRLSGRVGRSCGCLELRKPTLLAGDPPRADTPSARTGL
ncbi:MAG: MTAP family purine nucleoside phosphorylase [Firmicutes bacterium]|nr:MTAP family purine nucleoside phosphorylase [Bacillota bacterium]